MAERQRIDIVCDYPGCERRLTELGGRMALTSDGPTQAVADITFAADLCREHRRSLENWWNRGREDEAAAGQEGNAS